MEVKTESLLIHNVESYETTLHIKIGFSPSHLLVQIQHPEWKQAVRPSQLCDKKYSTQCLAS